MTIFSLLRLISLGGCLLLLAACQTAQGPEGAFASVQEFAAQNLRRDVVRIRNGEDEAAVRERVKALLKAPLTADAAVQVALINNRGLQAAYAELGIAEAERWKESLPPSPKLTLSRVMRGDEFSIERKIVADLVSLLSLPLRADIAAQRLEQAKLRAMLETMRIAANTRRAFYRAVAARHNLEYLREARIGAEAASDLAKKLGETGAWSKLDQAREHVFYAEISAQTASAAQRAGAEREKLARAMGLWGSDLNFRTPARLPNLPAKAESLKSIEADAIARRIDIDIARRDVEILARNLGLTRATGFINVLEAGPMSESENGEPNKRGVEVELSVPIFDFGQSNVKSAEETYMRAVHRLGEKAVNARSQARVAYQSYRGAYDLARHYRNEIVPLRKVIADEELLRNNGMLNDTFRLIAEARQSIQSNAAAIEAERDFWLASIDLFSVVAGGAVDEAGAMSVAQAAPPAQAGGH